LIRLAVGVDAGGSRTRVVVTRDEGQILSHSEGGPGNVRSVDSDAAITLATKTALAKVGADPHDVALIACGVAGASSPERHRSLERRLLADFPHSTAFATSDAEAALAGVTDDPCDGPALLIIAGTGSIALGRDGQGRTARAGGHGWLAGDEGSAVWIVRLALGAALRDHDDRGPATHLRRALLEHEECGPEEFLDQLTRSPANGVPVPTALARLFPAVLEVARDGDVFANEIFRRAGEELALALAGVARKLDLGSNTPAGFTGGAFAAAELLLEPLHEALDRSLPDAPDLRVKPVLHAPEIAVLRLARAIADRGAH